MSSSSVSKWAKSRNLKLGAQDGSCAGSSGRTRRSNSIGSAPSRCRCVSVFGNARMSSSSSKQILRIQLLQGLRHELTVLADEFAVEADFASAVGGRLD